MSTRTATPLPRRSEAQNHRAADTRDRGTSGPTGLWILPVMWKTPAMRSAQLSGRRRRVSHNTLVLGGRPNPAINGRLKTGHFR